MPRLSRMAALIIPAAAVIGAAWTFLSPACRSRYTSSKVARPPGVSRGNAAEDDGAPPTEAACRAAHRTVLARVNAVQRHEGLPAIPFEAEAPFRLDHDGYYATELGFLGGGQGSAAELQFLGRGCQTVIFVNNAGMGAVYGKTARLYDQPPPPQWSRERALAFAGKLLAALAGEERVERLRLSAAKYDHVGVPNRYRAGEWSFRWSRISAEGHEFVYDRATVDVSEVSGLLFFALCWNSIYEQRPRSLLARERAIELAMPYAEKIMDWPPNREWFGIEHLPPARERFAGPQFRWETTAELMIVNPNQLLKDTTIDGHAHAWDRNARLAWAVRVRIRCPGPKGQEGTPLGGDVTVWIDAETGEFLGGEPL